MRWRVPVFWLMLICVAYPLVPGTAQSAGGTVVASRTAVEPKPLALVYFRADWCVPCKTLGPTVRETVAQLPAAQCDLIEIDLSNAQTRLSSAHTANRSGLGWVIDRYGDRAGRAVLVDPAAAQVLDLITAGADVPQLTRKLAAALDAKRAQVSTSQHAQPTPSP